MMARKKGKDESRVIHRVKMIFELTTDGMFIKAINDGTVVGLKEEVLGVYEVETTNELLEKSIGMVVSIVKAYIEFIGMVHRGVDIDDEIKKLETKLKEDKDAPEGGKITG